MMNFPDEASLAYSRLDAAAAAPKPTCSTRSNSIWGFLKKPANISILPTSKSMLKKAKHNAELEREWLLLGEPPQSPRVAVSAEQNVESCMRSDAPLSDIDCITKENGTDSESSTDIDAIVDEYRQKVKVRPGVD